MTLNIFAKAPNFNAASTIGQIDFHEWKRGSRVALILWSHRPTHGDMQDLETLAADNMKILAVAPEVGVESETVVISDSRNAIAALYDAPIGGQTPVRSLLIISPANTVDLAMSQPAAVRLDIAEIRRVAAALILPRFKLAAPADWRNGGDVVVGRVLADSTARARFGELTTLTRYLRFIRQPAHTRCPHPAVEVRCADNE